MIPCLYKYNETEFNTNGIGKLADAITCYVTEERNGSYELEMTYPITGIHADSLEEERIILAKPNDTSQTQPFRIYKISTPIDGILTIYGRHISYQLNYIPVVPPVSATGCSDAMAALLDASIGGEEFAFYTDNDSTVEYSIDTPDSLRNYLGGVSGSLLDVYGGEYEWDRFDIKLWTSRGADNGVRIVYGKNLTDFKHEINSDDVITGVYPYWMSDDGETYVELSDKVVEANVFSSNLTRVMVLDCSGEFDEEPTEDQLRSYAESYLKNSSYLEPAINITVDFLNLQDLPGYEDIAEAEHVSLCDTVHVYVSKLGIDVSSKVTKTKYDTLLERYSSITLSNSNNGSTSSSLANMIVSAQKQTEEEISARAAAIRRLNNKLSNSSGLFMTEETQSDGSIVYYMHDHQSLADSDIIWKLTAEAFGISLDGGKTYPYGFTVTGEMVMALIDVEELFAQDITATGTISGATIKGAAISGSTITGGTITGGTINGGTINSATLNAATGSFSSTSGNYATSITGGKISLQYTGSGSTIDIYASGASLAIKNSVEGNTSIQLPNQASIMFENESGSYTAAIHYGSDYRLTLTGYAGVDVTSTLYTRDVLPYKDNYYSLGTSSYRWATIYATSGTVSTSDRNKKHDIKPVSDKYMDFFYKLSAVSYMKNGGDRTHIGGISQDVLEALKAAGLTAEDFGGFCQDEKIAYAEHGEDGHGIESSKYVVTDEDGNPEYDYGLRYEEFIFLCVEAIQRQKKEIDTLKDAVAKLATAA